jgi:autotransporter translocation and assembly factor TamB
MDLHDDREPQGFSRRIEAAVIIVIAVLVLAFFWFLSTHSGIHA